MKNFGISLIVPAYNEEKRIKNILTVASTCPYLQEIICVNDGSTDNTLALSKSVKNISVINLKKNHGKSYAIMEGVKAAKGDIVVFLDADLRGLTHQTIRSLINPLITKSADVVIGYKSSRIDKLFKPLGGERAYFRKDLLPLEKTIRQKGYGLELYLNYSFRKKRVKTVLLHGLTHESNKYAKQSTIVATKNILRELKDIFSEIMQQRNPYRYFLFAYLSPFYIKSLQNTRR